MSNSIKRPPKWLNIKLPQMRCDEHCGACCGPVICSETEIDLIERYCVENGIVPQNEKTWTCPYYQKGRCAIYPVRPLLCRLFGHVDRMVCPRGYNRNISQEKEERIMSRYAKKTEGQRLMPLSEKAEKILDFLVE